MFGLQFYLINVYHPQTLYSLERNQKTAWKNKIHEFVQIIVYISKCKRKYTAKYADGIIPISVIRLYFILKLLRCYQTPEERGKVEE